jgi:hypothetical protein
VIYIFVKILSETFDKMEEYELIPLPVWQERADDGKCKRALEFLRNFACRMLANKQVVG